MELLIAGLLSYGVVVHILWLVNARMMQDHNRQSGLRGPLDRRQRQHVALWAWLWPLLLLLVVIRWDRSLGGDHE